MNYRRRPSRGSIPAYVGSAPQGAWQAAWAYTESLLTALGAETEAMGAKFVVAVVSAREEVYPEWWDEAQKTYPAMQQQGLDVDAPRRRVVDFCRAKGIHV